MSFFSNLGDKLKGIPAAIKSGFSGIASWSVSTKIMASVCALTAVVLVGASGLLIHDTLEKKAAQEAAAEAAAEAEAQAQAEKEAAEKAAAEAAAKETEVVAEKPEVTEKISIELPNFVACKISSDSLEKDLTLYIKGKDSGKKISGTKFEIKLIDPNKKSEIAKYVTAIDDVTAKIDKAKSDKTYDDPSGKTLDDINKDAKSSDKKKDKTENKNTSSSAKNAELTKGEVLLFEKEKAISDYKTALSSMKGETYTDSDSDGMIYVKEIKSGDYIACFVPADDYDAVDYMTKVNVKDKVEYKKVETIEDKTVDAAAAGDSKPAEAAPVEAVLQDTVEFVAPSKTLVSGGGAKSAPATMAPAAGNNTTVEKEYTTTTSKRSGGVRAVAAVTGKRTARMLSSMAVGDATATISLASGETTTMTVTGIPDGATANLTATSNSSNVTASVSGNVITIAAASNLTAAETATVTVGGNYSESESQPAVSATITVNVSAAAAQPEAASFTLSANSATVNMGTPNNSIAIQNPVGIASYAASGYDNTVIDVAISGTTVTLTPKKVGTTNVTITGTADPTHTGSPTASIAVTVQQTTTTAKATAVVPSAVTIYAKSGMDAITITPTLTNCSLSSATPVVSSNANVVVPTVSGSSVVLKAGSMPTSTTTAKVTYSLVCADGRTTFTATTDVTLIGSATPLKDTSGAELYTDEACTKAATLANYAANATFYKKGGEAKYKYTGWQVINGNSFFYDKNGNAVTGTQVIQGVKYNFGSDGALLVSGTGIDVSKWQGNIDWSQAKTAVGFAIIRCGFRGSSGGIAVDPMFAQNARNAKANGVKIGLYFYSRATTEAQAVEEASLAIQCAQQAGGLSYPIYIDMEDASQAGLSNEQRTAIINAFCATVRNSGYRAGVYANKNWLTNKINTGSLSGCSVWCAQYNTTCTYGGKKDMWQYSSKGSVPGISGNVDMNISYF